MQKEDTPNERAIQAALDRMREVHNRFNHPPTKTPLVKRNKLVLVVDNTKNSTVS